MNLIGRDKLLAASYGWHTIFNNRLAEAPKLYEQISMVVPSDSPIEVYRWLNSVPAMRKWVGDRVIHKLSAEGFQIANEDYANGVEIERDDLRDDKLGMVEQRVRQCADAGPAAINKAVFTLLNAAMTTTAWDNQYLVDTDHTASSESGATSQSNKGTAVLSETSFNAALAAFLALQGDNGEALELMPKYLVTGIDATTWQTAREILRSDMNAAGTATNLNQGIVQHIVSQHITGPKWFLIADPAQAPAVIVQIRQQAVLRTPVTDFDDFYAFLRKTLYYGADMTFGVGPGMWQGIYGSTGGA